jgi:hypothetical protein
MRYYSESMDKRQDRPNYDGYDKELKRRKNKAENTQLNNYV